MIGINYTKLDEKAVEPFKKHEPDAGWDLTATWKKETDKFIEYGTGLAFEIPVGYVGLLFPRSSVTKEDLILKNSVGVVDSGFVGEIRFRFAKYHHDLFTEENLEKDVNCVSLHDKLRQRLEEYHPWINSNHIAFRLPDYYEVGDRVDQLGESERGSGGYGSTGK